jgi:Predicted AAA-ATPase/PD-(D/E)XK nuclease superfamily
MKNQRLSISTQSFEVLRKDNELYVDKTDLIYQLIKTGRNYFLSRPRRFGKSLLLTTLEALFQGRKDLFKGLWIEDKINWEEYNYPVILLSFSGMSTNNGQFRASVETMLEEAASEQKIKLTKKGITNYTRQLIKKTAEKHGNNVVLLIDEYDKPLHDYLEDLKTAEENRFVLKEFFETLKASHKYIRFQFVTGVTKIAKVAVFSGFNNPKDISRSPQFATLLGWTQSEVEHYFSDRIPEIAEIYKYTLEKTFTRLKRDYNGYNFGGESVYNPWSVMQFVDDKRFRNYWFQTGDPEFAIKKVFKSGAFSLGNMTVSPDVLDAATIENQDYRSLLYQAGYLTVINEDIENNLITLGFPNFEVEQSFNRHLWATYVHCSVMDTGVAVTDLREAMQTHNTKQVVKIFNGLFGSIPERIFYAEHEAYFHAVIFLTFTLLSYDVRAEVFAGLGRADAVVHTPDRIWLFEFKLNGTAADAMQQIEDRQYAQKYAASGKELALVGLAFDAKKRIIREDWQEKIIPKI